MRLNKKAQMDDSGSDEENPIMKFVPVLILALAIVVFFVFFLPSSTEGKTFFEKITFVPEKKLAPTDPETLLKCRSISLCRDYTSYSECMLNPCESVTESCQWYYNSCLVKKDSYDLCLTPDNVPLLDDNGVFQGCKECVKAACTDYHDEALCLTDQCGLGCMPFYDQKTDGQTAGWTYADCRSCQYVNDRGLGCKDIIKKELCTENACGLNCAWNEGTATCS